MDPDESDRLSARWWSGPRGAAGALAAAGLATMLCSFSTWATCSTIGCNGPLQAFDSLSGIDFGYGNVTVVAGALLTAIGIEAHAKAGVSRLATIAVQLSLLVIVTVMAFVVDVYVFRDRLLSLWGPPWEMLSVWGIPGFGAILSACGGVLAMLASRRLQRAWDARLDGSVHH